jgi:hypothetical protein
MLITVPKGDDPLPHGCARTIIITGAARGGTSFAASICHHIGVPMGRPGPRYENPYLQRAVLLGAWDVVEMLVAEISEELPLWGWKLPALMRHLQRVAGLVRAPHFILIFKNPLALSARGKRLTSTLQWYRKMAEFAQSTRAPTLLVSYEGAMSDMPTTIRTFADFCGIAAEDPGYVASQVAQDKRLYLSPQSQSPVHTAPTYLESRLSGITEQNGVTVDALLNSRAA